MSGQMPAGQWSMDSPAAKWRNWNTSNTIEAFFGTRCDAAFVAPFSAECHDRVAAVRSGVGEMGASGEAAFKSELYRSMISQVLFLKTEIEGWRSANVWGTVIPLCLALQAGADGDDSGGLIPTPVLLCHARPFRAAPACAAS